MRREIRFPDAGKDEKGAPAETNGSWGLWEAVKGVYHEFDLITVILGPRVPGTLLLILPTKH